MTEVKTPEIEKEVGKQVKKTEGTIIKLKLKDIVPYKRNAKIHTESQISKIRDSIINFGYKDPIAVDENNLILEGHGRLLALYQIDTTGEKEISVLKITDLTEPEKKAYRIAHNKIGMDTGFDMEILKEEFYELEDTDNFNDTGFNREEITEIWDQKKVKEDDFNFNDSLKNPRYMVKTGDVYVLGAHRLMCGDSTKKEDIDKIMGGETIKLIFTSPPYNMASGMYKNYVDNLKSEEYIDLNINCLKLLKKYLRGFVFWNLSYNKKTRWEFMDIFNKIRTDVGLRFLELIVWNKKHALPITSKQLLTRQYEDIALFGTEDEVKEQLELYWTGTTEKLAYFNKSKGKGITNYWELNVDRVQLDEHKACFPVGLAAKGIKLMTDEREIVMDPFGGSGSTLIACEQLGRRCFTMELDQKYTSGIIERWEKLTNKKAVKV